MPLRSGFAGDRDPGCPGSPVLSAVPTNRYPGCPGSGLSVSPMIRPSGRPVLRIFRLRLVAPLRVSPKRTFRFCQWPDHRVSPDRSPLVSPSDGTSGLPRIFPSAGGADRPFPSCPEAGVCGAGFWATFPGCPGPPALRPPSMPLRVTPLGRRRWVDDESRLSLNFASAACTVDESSRPTGSVPSAWRSKLSLVSPGPAAAACAAIALS